MPARCVWTPIVSRYHGRYGCRLQTTCAPDQDHSKVAVIGRPTGRPHGDGRSSGIEGPDRGPDEPFVTTSGEPCAPDRPLTLRRRCRHSPLRCGTCETRSLETWTMWDERPALREQVPPVPAARCARCDERRHALPSRGPVVSLNRRDGSNPLSVSGPSSGARLTALLNSSARLSASSHSTMTAHPLSYGLQRRNRSSASLNAYLLVFAGHHTIRESGRINSPARRGPEPG